MLNLITRFFRRAGQKLSGRHRPRFHAYRQQGTRSAIVLVHGFSGDVLTVWKQYADGLCNESRLANWDILGAGYSTSLRIDIPGVWEADPGLQMLADGLRTTLSLPPFDQYQVIAIVAHSMGGLVVQRALVDDDQLAARSSHVFMFGVPSAGLDKSKLFAALKPQIADIDPAGAFIVSLRKDWTSKFGTIPRFKFLAIGGERDTFVSSESSLDPFDKSLQRVIDDNHSGIVRPTGSLHQGLSIVVQSICGLPRPNPAIDAGKLAAEHSQFQAAVNALHPNVATLDESALISLALALDGLGRPQDALGVLENNGRHLSTSDAMATLAGRYKRRWLVDRHADDLQRSNELYETALSQADAIKDYAQCYYPAINLASLAVMSTAPNSAFPQSARDFAEHAIQYCGKCQPATHWSYATEGEAALILGDLDRAEMFYQKAKSKTSSPRDLDSMYSQAIRVAGLVHGESGAQRIERLFGVPNP
jgi:pimeloyl-ACP methyl ester carboxylesterase